VRVHVIRTRCEHGAPKPKRERTTCGRDAGSHELDRRQDGGGTARRALLRSVVDHGQGRHDRDLAQQRPAVHDIHARDGSFDSPLLNPGNSFTFSFTKPGLYRYYCIPHEGDGMIGQVEVQ